MRVACIGLLLAATICSSFGQDFEYGKISRTDLEMKTYELDTAAEAVVLKEFGEAHIESGGNYNLFF